MQGRLRYRNDAERERARAMGIDDVEKVFRIDELARGDVMFAATGVTNGDFLKGVRFTGDGARTHSVVMRSRTGTVRYIETEHHFQQQAQLRLVATGEDGGAMASKVSKEMVVDVPVERVLGGGGRLRGLPGLRARGEAHAGWSTTTRA